MSGDVADVIERAHAAMEALGDNPTKGRLDETRRELDVAWDSTPAARSLVTDHYETLAILDSVAEFASRP